MEFVRPIAEQAGVTLAFVEGDDNLAIQGNENALRQIILNLVCNAIRHTPAGGRDRRSRPRREATAEAHRALVEIKDTGCGIPRNVVERIFDAGFSGTGDTPGLGLAVCKRLMDQHGGEIRVSSRVNGGSTFELEFPAL